MRWNWRQIRWFFAAVATVAFRLPPNVEEVSGNEGADFGVVHADEVSRETGEAAIHQDEGRLVFGDATKTAGGRLGRG